MAGNKVLVDRATVHLSAPGVDGGATFNQYKNLFQVIFNISELVTFKIIVDVKAIGYRS